MRTHDAHESAFRGVVTALTIHNLGYQGMHDPWVLGLAGFGLEYFYPGSPFEYWGRVNDMKIGLLFADALTTVSPRYASEIQSSPEFGAGLEGVLRRRSADLTGILNGIDDQVWNPATDPHLAHAHLHGEARAVLATADRLEGLRGDLAGRHQELRLADVRARAGEPPDRPESRYRPAAPHQNRHPLRRSCAECGA